MPDPLPWLREFLDVECISAPNGFRDRLTELVRSELSRERAAAVEGCARLCEAHAKGCRTAIKSLSVWTPRPDTSKFEAAAEAADMLALEIRTKSDIPGKTALPLEAAATPTPEIREAPDAEYLRKYSEAVLKNEREGVRALIKKHQDDARAKHNAFARESGVCSGSKYWDARWFALEDFLGDWLDRQTPCIGDPPSDGMDHSGDAIAHLTRGPVTYAPAPTEPLTPAAVREIAREEARRAAAEALRRAIAATEAYVGSLHKRCDALLELYESSALRLLKLESRDVRAEIERYMAERPALKATLHRTIVRPVPQFEPDGEELAPTVSGANRIEAALRKIVKARREEIFAINVKAKDLGSRSLAVDSAIHEASMLLESPAQEAQRNGE